MPAYLITGLSGSGKSYLATELKKRGLRVIETDAVAAMTGWVNIATGEKVSDLPVRPYPAEWLDAHHWWWDAAVLQRLIGAIPDEPVFFVGGAENEDVFYHLFEYYFALVADSSTLVKRLQRRNPVRYPEGCPELQRELVWHEQIPSYYSSRGAIVVDSSVSVELVADTVLGHVGHLERYKSRKVYWVLRLYLARRVRKMARRVRNALYWVRRARR